MKESRSPRIGTARRGFQNPDLPVNAHSDVFQDASSAGSESASCEIPQGWIDVEVSDRVDGRSSECPAQLREISAGTIAQEIHVPLDFGGYRIAGRDGSNDSGRRQIESPDFRLKNGDTFSSDTGDGCDRSPAGGALGRRWIWPRRLIPQLCSPARS